VRRSNALRGYAYGRSFRYREAMSVGTSPLSPVLAAATKIGLGALAVGLMLPPTRFVLDRLLPKPGDGPDERARERGHFTMDLFTTTSTGARYTARVRAKGDPGYAGRAWRSPPGRSPPDDPAGCMVQSSTEITKSAPAAGHDSDSGSADGGVRPRGIRSWPVVPVLRRERSSA
jgi:hypothetical protein